MNRKGWMRYVPKSVRELRPFVPGDLRDPDIYFTPEDREYIRRTIDDLGGPYPRGYIERTPNDASEARWYVRGEYAPLPTLMEEIND